MLAQQRLGPAEGRPVLIAHGLFGSARNWGVIARRLAETRPVVVVDMRNHGESSWLESHDYPGMAEDLAEVIDGQWDVVGHSMGGKAAMVLALRHPQKVRAMVVADIAPVTYSHTQMQYIDAMKALDLASVDSRGDADRHLAALVPEDGVRAFLLQSLDVKARRWRLNLEVLAAHMADIIGFPDVEGQFEGPVLFLSGGDSAYVLPAHRDRIKSLFPNAKFAKMPGVGHWLHAEKPREFEASLRAFLG